MLTIVGSAMIEGKFGRASILALLAVLAAALGGCYEQASLRYRITVEVDTPQGLRTGSSVWDIASSAGPGIPGPEAASISSKIRGEAVAVDLPGGTLFALLGGDKGTDYPFFVVTQHLAQYPDSRVETVPQDWAETRRRIQHAGIGFVLAKDELPMLVRFSDPKNPMSVAKVDHDALDKAFGPGVRLRRVTIQMTSDEVTYGLEKQLKWLPRIGGGYLHGRLTSRGAPMGLHGGDFSKEKF